MTDPTRGPSTPPDRRSTGTQSPVVAGSLILSAIVLCAALGFGVGALVGAAVPLGIAGLLAGVAVGIALVIARFRDL
jgi:hypothetical protein